MSFFRVGCDELSEEDDEGVTAELTEGEGRIEGIWEGGGGCREVGIVVGTEAVIVAGTVVGTVAVVVGTESAKRHGMSV